MSLPSTGPISIGDINVELGMSRTQANTSLWDMERGFYAVLNQASVNKPNQAKPCSLSEWRGYIHTDATAPSVPVSTGYTFLGTWSGDDDTFAWSPSTDNIKVTGYELLIYKNETYLTTYVASLDGSNNPYSLVGFNYNHLAIVYGSGSYVFKVRARDAAGNWSALSTGMTYVFDQNKPAPFATSLTATSITSSSFTLGWAATTRTDAIGYKIMRNSVLFATVGLVTSFNVNGLSASTNYTFSVTAYLNDTIYANSAALSVNTSAAGDTTAPTVPGTLTATSFVGGVDLSWGTSTDAGSFVTYEVNRSGLFYGETTDTFYTDDTGDTSVRTYKIRARDESYNYSGFGNSVNKGGLISCFVKGTLIALSDGTKTTIEKLLNNQELLSSKIESFVDTNIVDELYKWSSNTLIEERIESSITKISSKIVSKTIVINDGLLETTPEHSQLIQRNNIWRFIPMGTVKVGDKLYNINKEIITITSMFINTEERTVYPMTLDNVSHTYFANGILTHNIKQQ
jgi:hypothetical protein